MSKKLLITLSIIATSVVFGFIIIGSLAGYYNRGIELENTFTQKIDERTAFYDKMVKIISQKAQVAVKNDSAFRDVVNSIMSAREDGANVMFKWIKESNPAVTFGEVSKLYADLSRTIEAQREGFFEEEKLIQDVVKQHNDLIRKFPANIIFLVYGTQPLKYSPIQSSTTKEVMKTGIDDNTEVFK